MVVIAIRSNTGRDITISIRYVFISFREQYIIYCCKYLQMFAMVFYSIIEFLNIWKPQDAIQKMEDVIGSMFDFGLFLILIVAIFSIIGIGCISLGAYATLRNDSQKRKQERMRSEIAD